MKKLSGLSEMEIRERVERVEREISAFFAARFNEYREEQDDLESALEDARNDASAKVPPQVSGSFDDETLTFKVDNIADIDDIFEGSAWLDADGECITISEDQDSEGTGSYIVSVYTSHGGCEHTEIFRHCDKATVKAWLLGRYETLTVKWEEN